MSDARVSPLILTALRLVVALLVIIGVVAAVGRGTFIDDFAHRAEPLRLRLIGPPPHAEEELAEVDDKFGNHRVITLLHVVPGGLFLLLAPIQFIPAIRNRFLTAHRRLGRVLLIAALISGAAGVFFGLFRPLGGVREAIGIAIFGAFLFISAIRAYIAIRKGDVLRHREWMIRAFATALAISTVRVVAGALDAAHLWVNDARGAFVLSIWSGWLVTLAMAELWIRYSRGRFSLGSSSSSSQQLRLRIPVPESPLIREDVSTL